MTYLVERLAELRRHLDHLRELAPRVENREALARDLSLHNDVLFSLSTIRLGPKDVPQPDLHLRFAASAQNRTEGRYLDGPPELVAEIALSSASIDLHEKLESYRRHGVLEYTVWRVHDEAVDWFHLAEGEYRRLEPDTDGVIHSHVFHGLRLAVQALIGGDMATVLAVQQRQ
jgi:Uma2 family endonuclease